MLDLYAGAGESGPWIVGGSSGVVVLAGWVALLWVFRWRPSAFFYWMLPAAVLIGAGVAAWLGIGGGSAIWRPGATSPPNAADLYAAGNALGPIALAGFSLAAALTVSGTVLALPNVLRAGGPSTYTLKHAFFAFLVAAFSLTAGFVGGWAALVVANLGSFCVALASLRIGRDADGRRMAAGRGFVAAQFGGAGLCLAFGYTALFLNQRLLAWAEGVPFSGSVAPVAGALVLVCFFILAGMVAMLPHAKRVLDGRTAAGLLFSLFLTAPVAAAVLPPLQVAAGFAEPDPAAIRQLALRKLGIDLVPLDGAPWSAMPTLTVGPYWVYWNGERVLPFQGARVPSRKLLDGVAVDVLDYFTPIATGRIGFEVDRNVDLLRLRPVLRAAQSAELFEVCFTTRTETGALRTLSTSLAKARHDGVHVLLGPDTLTWIDGDHARDTSLAELVGKNFVLHVDDYTAMPQLFELLDAAGDGEVTLWLK